MLERFLQQSNPQQPKVDPNTSEGLAPANVVPGDVFGESLRNLADTDWWSWILGATGILGVLSAIWSIYVFLAYLFCVILLGIYVYASVRFSQLAEIQTQTIRDAEALYDQYYRAENQPSRLTEVKNHIASGNPNDWKLAIIEADILLDDILKEKGFAGNSLGERLRSISPNQLTSLTDAWEAHTVRNKIAHQGSDFILTERIAHETINRYLRVFEEFDIR